MKRLISFLFGLFRKKGPDPSSVFGMTKPPEFGPASVRGQVVNPMLAFQQPDKEK